MTMSTQIWHDLAGLAGFVSLAGFVGGYIVVRLVVRWYREGKARKALPSPPPPPAPPKYVAGGQYLVTLYTFAEQGKRVTYKGLNQMVIQVYDVSHDGRAVNVTGDMLSKRGWVSVDNLEMLSVLSLPEVVIGDARGSYRGES